MKYFENYHLPSSVDEALDLLAHYAGRARIIAGGTDLLLDLQSDYIEGHRPHYDALVDVTRIAGANEIRAEGGWIIVGCGVTHSQVVESDLIQSRATALAEACAVVGGPQVRNVATLVGNVAHALPAADGTIALMALDAEVQIASHNEASGRSLIHGWRPLGSLFRGPGESVVDPTHELIVAVRFRPSGEHEASAFNRIMRPQGVALPVLGLATRIKLSIQHSAFSIEDVAISAGPVAPVPFRARQTEEFLRGQSFSQETVARAQELLLGEARPRTSPHRATKEYRVELLPNLFSRTLECAVARARQASE